MDNLSDYKSKSKQCIECKCIVHPKNLWYQFHDRNGVIVEVPICEKCSSNDEGLKCEDDG